MFCIKNIMLKYYMKSFLILMMTFIFVACSGGGVQTGSSTEDFFGAKDVQVTSPTSVKISWQRNPAAKEYQIFINSSTAPIGTTALDFYNIENLNPEMNYSFKVVAAVDGKNYGTDKEIKVTTWPRFSGVSSARADGQGAIKLSWAYNYPVQKYLVFYRKDSAPTASSTNNWSAVNNETTTNSITLTGLDNSSKYYFVVHAQYRDTEKEITTKSLALTTQTSFSTPLYSISPISIGNVPTLTVDPVEDTLHGENFFKTTVLWNGVAVSDPLIGKGQIVLSASANLPLGKVENISLKVEYADGNRAETMLIEGLSTYIKGIPTNIEKPAVAGLTAGASYLGKALAKGDFNCDGLDDLAVGVPEISVGELGVKAPRAGAVIVYYSREVSAGVLQLNTSGTPSLAPAPGAPQIITFDDLVDNERFGFSLSGGNFNGDKNGVNPCDDLLVGAPGGRAPTLQNGAAYIFYGSRNGLSSASHLSDMAANTATCDGSLNNAVCAPVRLYEDPTKIPVSLTGNQQLTATNDNNNRNNFGYSVSFIGDFNADGFDDIAIGSPYSPFDGRLSNIQTTSRTIQNAGAVFIFFGSKFGVGFEYPAATSVPNPTVDAKATYLKIFAPVPQYDARFGWSVAGGADIDGSYKIRANSGANYYGGGDLVVGAPGFLYENFEQNNYLARNPYSVGTDPNINSILESPSSPEKWWADIGGVSINAASNYYGFSQVSRVGAAFIYFGRGSNSIPSSDESPSRSAFWKCGRRGMNSNEHYSCLFDNLNVKMLTPRKSAIATGFSNFGASVAVIGSRSRYKENSTDLLTAPPGSGEVQQYFSDTNEDGFADVVVGAPNTTVGGKANVGALTVFYGNPTRLFNPKDLYNLYADNTATSDAGSNAITCASFVNTATNPHARNCKPVILSSLSLAAGTLLGNGQSQMAVGDVTGDGLKDLAVGASGDDVIGAGSGAALVYISVKAGGLSPTYKKIYTTSADSDDNLGQSVIIGNFNGDRNPTNDFIYNDLFVGAPNDEVNRPAGGAVYGFYTQNAALAATRSSHDVLITESLASFTEYGLDETRLVGDINNDGYTDAVSKITSYAATGQKTSDAVVYFGSAIGLITTSFCLENQAKIFKTGSGSADCYPSVSPKQGITLNDIQLPQRIVRPTNLDFQWNFLPVDAGDVNNDGFADILFVPHENASNKFSTLYFGSRTGLLNVIDPSWVPAMGDPQIVSNFLVLQDRYAGYSWNSTSSRYPFVAADFNQDGYSDLAFGLPYSSSRRMNQSGSTDTPDPSGLVGGGNPTLGGGWLCQGSLDAVCTGGEGVQYSGTIRIIYGSAQGYQTPKRNGSSGDIDRGGVYTINMAGTEESATKPCEPSSTTTDPICRPTYMDNPVFENIEFGFSKLDHHFGQSIAVADMNNDGYPDVLVSSPYYEDLSCHSGSTYRDYGRVFVFYGSETGVIATDARKYYTPDLGTPCPATFADDKALQNTNGGRVRAIMPSVVDYGSAANKTERYFGFSMTAAGDVNGDGYDDLIIATPYETIKGQTRVGGMYIYYGPLCPADNFSQITDDFQSDDNLNVQKFFKGQLPVGAATSQETNVTITDTSVTNTCFRGASSKMKPMPQKFYVMSGIANEYWGLSIITGKKTKGDFNKDSFDDVIIGSPYYDDLVRGVTDVGQGVVYFGSALGLYTGDYPATTVVVKPSGQLRPYSITPVGYGNNSRFFSKMSASGDINGDGTMDILVPSKTYKGTTPFKGVDIGTFFIFN